MARARSLSEFQKAFSDEASCVAFLFKRRWPDGFICPGCSERRNEFVFCYNRRFHRHVSFEALLGLAAHYEPASYWDIVKRDNPRMRAETLRRAPRRSKMATGMRQDRAPPAQGVRRDQPIKRGHSEVSLSTVAATTLRSSSSAPR